MIFRWQRKYTERIAARKEKRGDVFERFAPANGVGDKTKKTSQLRDVNQVDEPRRRSSASQQGPSLCARVSRGDKVASEKGPFHEVEM